ncbi:hypothetical protein ABEB36_005959 [Hypothenemus hampei]|uniref:Uncharacterized protein n=1 Tax=Hypothenemus hampei TaxID=57062 RepID=A0ABD1F002_HYPHA
MKGIVTLSIVLSLSIGLARSEAGSKDELLKQAFTTTNTIGQTPKPELLSYQQINQNYAGKYQPQHLVYHQQYQPRTQQLQQTLSYSAEKPTVGSQQHQSTPVAMVIIAQPAYVPVSMLQQNNVAQHLLQLFQGGSSTLKYQYVPPNHSPTYQPIAQTQPIITQTQPIITQTQPQQSQQYVQYQPQQELQNTEPSAQEQTAQTQFFPQESLPVPQALIAPQQHVFPHNLNQHSSGPSGRSALYQPEAHQIEFQPNQLQQIDEQQPETQSPDFSKLAQEAAQHFLNSGGLASGSRTAPAIITGLEHFSPEQQEKIKAQLSAHFGSPLKPLNFGGSPGKQSQEASIAGRKYFQDQRQRIRSEKFVPSIQVKDGEITQTTAGGATKI